MGRDSVDANLHARFDVSGSGAGLGGMTWTADVSGSGRYGRARLDSLALRAQLDQGVLRLDTLMVASNVAHGGGGGTVALVDSAGGLRAAAGQRRAPAPGDRQSVGACGPAEPGTHDGAQRYLVVDATPSGRSPADRRDRYRPAEPSGELRRRYRARGLLGGGPGRKAQQRQRRRSRAGSSRCRSASCERARVPCSWTPPARRTSPWEWTGMTNHRIRMAGTAQPADSLVRLDSLNLTCPRADWHLAEGATIRYGQNARSW